MGFTPTYAGSGDNKLDVYGATATASGRSRFLPGTPTLPVVSHWWPRRSVCRDRYSVRSCCDKHRWSHCYPNVELADVQDATSSKRCRPRFGNEFDRRGLHGFDHHAEVRAG